MKTIPAFGIEGWMSIEPLAREEAADSMAKGVDGTAPSVAIVAAAIEQMPILYADRPKVHGEAMPGDIELDDARTTRYPSGHPKREALAALSASRAYSSPQIFCFNASAYDPVSGDLHPIRCYAY